MVTADVEHQRSGSGVAVTPVIASLFFLLLSDLFIGIMYVLFSQSCLVILDGLFLVTNRQGIQMAQKQGAGLVKPICRTEYLAAKRNGKSEILPKDISMTGQLYCTSKQVGEKGRKKQDYKQRN